MPKMRSLHHLHFSRTDVAMIRSALEQMVESMVAERDALPPDDPVRRSVARNLRAFVQLRDRFPVLALDASGQLVEVPAWRPN